MCLLFLRLYSRQLRNFRLTVERHKKFDENVEAFIFVSPSRSTVWDIPRDPGTHNRDIPRATVLPFASLIWPIEPRESASFPSRILRLVTPNVYIHRTRGSKKEEPFRTFPYPSNSHYPDLCSISTREKSKWNKYQTIISGYSSPLGAMTSRD